MNSNKGFVSLKFTLSEKAIGKHNCLSGFIKKKLFFDKVGFTLIELLIVMAILGILVATIAPRYVGFTQDAKVATTKAGLACIREALTVYGGKNDATYPSSAGDLSVLVPDNIDRIPTNKLTETNSVAADCAATVGWAYDGNGVVKACCNSSTPDGCGGSGDNAIW